MDGTPFSSQDPLHPEIREQDEQKQEPVRTSKGCLAGGKCLSELDGDEAAEYGPLHRIPGVDIPLTITEETTDRSGEPIILLSFRPGDPENPFNWPIARRRFISALLCLMTLFIGLATTAYSSGIPLMVRDLHTSTEMGQLGLFCFNMSCAVAPLFLAPFCELVGRKVVYTASYGLFALVFIGLALGQNIATILVMRTLLGLFGSVGTILVGGTFSDMYPPDERARPMALFSYVAILGTVAAPIYSGFIDETIGWRWTEGIQGLSNIPLFILVLFGLRETRGGVAMAKRAKALREVTGDDRYKSEMEIERGTVKEMLNTSCVRAIKMLITEPVVFAFGLWIGFTWAVVFIFLSVITITFQEKRGWSLGVGGLPYISLVIGVTIGYFANRLQMRKWDQIHNSPTRRIVPEDRLYGAMCGSLFLPLGLFLYSFTQYAYLPWIAPTISLAPISIGIFFVFESTYSLTSDCYGDTSSSAIAGQGLMRNTLGAVAPLFASQFFHNVGSQYAGLILALTATLLSFIPFVMFRFGHLLRERSKLAIKN